MSDMLQSASSWLADMLQTHVGQSVTYRRGGVDTTVTAVLARTLYEVEDSYGVSIRQTVIDWLVPADSISGDPEPGDRIVDANGVIYEAMDIAGTGAWSWTDGYRNTARIHTREVGSE